MYSPFWDRTSPTCPTPKPLYWHIKFYRYAAFTNLRLGILQEADRVGKNLEIEQIFKIQQFILNKNKSRHLSLSWGQLFARTSSGGQQVLESDRQIIALTDILPALQHFLELLHRPPPLPHALRPLLLLCGRQSFPSSRFVCRSSLGREPRKARFFHLKKCGLFQEIIC